MTKKNILFLGSAINPNEKIKAGYSIAANKMQLNILEQFSLYKNLKVDALTIYPIAPFPRNVIYSKSKKLKLTDKVTSHSIGFINLPIIKQIIQGLTIYFYARKYIKKNPDSILLTYNSSMQIGIPARILKKIYKKYVILLADPPIDYVTNRKKLYGYVMKVYNKLALIGINSCDMFVVINKKLIDSYSLKGRSILIEGGINPNDFNLTVTKSYEEKIIIYSGALTFYSGILNLIHAMNYLVDEKIKLYIYGRGNLEKRVSDYAHASDKVYFKGNLSNDKILEIQQRAWLLVNPRVVNDPISQLTFPSKILEYMMSGVPVLTTRLNGFTSEYSDKLFFSDGDDVSSIANAINNLTFLNEKDLNEKALMARKFVLENKNWKVQTEKIYEFILG